jgi:Cu-Zn family superoxide dismutase
MPLVPPVRRATTAAALAVAALTLAACGSVDTTPTAAGGPLAAKGGASSENPGGLPARYLIPGATVFPEGIAFDQRTGAVFVSSTTNGTVFRTDVKADAFAPFLAPGADGRTTAIGLEVDGEGRLYVAGGATGRVFVYDGSTGALLANLATGSAPTFVNDIAISRGDTAYITDSQSPVIYRVAPNAAGTLTLERWLSLTGTPAAYTPGFNLNGIEATPDGRYLFAVKSNSGELFRIDTRTRAVVEVDLGGATIPNGDGVYLQGSTLYVLQNQQETIVEVRLQVERARGTVVSRTTSGSFAYPTSLVAARGRLLVVNSQFDRRGPGLTPELPFTVSVVKKP